VAVAVARRLAVFLVSLAAASVLVFVFMAVLPGDPAEVALGVNATPESVAATRAAFGTDRPLVVQYADWAGGCCGVTSASRTSPGRRSGRRSSTRCS
jgi:peptide/nickel transport system permease protein